MSHSIYDPTLYDIFQPGSIRGDIEWYRNKARQFGGPILELGAGTGRITIPLAQDGHSVFALDLDQRMLASLNRKISKLPTNAKERITIIEGDMRSFHLDREFPLIMIPYRAFLHNTNYGDQIICLQRVYEHLKPGGCLAFNIFHPSLDYMSGNRGALEGVWRWLETFKLPDGGYILKSEAKHYDTIKKHIYSMNRYEQYDANSELSRTFLQQLELAYLYPDEIRYLLEKAGFRDIRIYGDINERPLENDTDEMFIEALRD